MSTANGAAFEDEQPEHEFWTPKANPWMITTSVMLATFMVVLDSSVANVALPHIAGNLSATIDESTWVLTSYLVSNAIMLPATGWISRRMGRKRLLMTSIGIFTLASLLCGIAITMPMLIIARILQGVGGGGMQPLAQSILLESFPPSEHGTAMAAYGIGIVVAPVIGPTLGGWITDSYSWRWIFYINLPVGILALFMVQMFVEDPPYLRRAVEGRSTFSALDRWPLAGHIAAHSGQRARGRLVRSGLDPLAAALPPSSHWWVSSCANSYIPSRSCTCASSPTATSAWDIITCLYGFVLYGSTALLPLFLQTLMGYPAVDSGLAVSPRGLGSIIAMATVGYLVRILIAVYCWPLALSFWAPPRRGSVTEPGYLYGLVALPNFFNGFAGGFIFVPLTTWPWAGCPSRRWATRPDLQPDAQHWRQRRHCLGHHLPCPRSAGSSKQSDGPCHDRQSADEWIYTRYAGQVLRRGL